MHQDAVTLGRTLRTFSRRKRSAVIRQIRRSSGVYRQSWYGGALHAISPTHHRVREIEELLVPTVRAGRVPVDEAQFLSSMRELNLTAECILRQLAFAVVEGGDRDSIDGVLWWVLTASFACALLTVGWLLV